MVQPPQAHRNGLYDNNGKGWYFRDDDDDDDDDDDGDGDGDGTMTMTVTVTVTVTVTMDYRYILSIKWIHWANLTHTTAHIAKTIREVTGSILVWALFNCGTFQQPLISLRWSRNTIVQPVK